MLPRFGRQFVKQEEQDQLVERIAGVGQRLGIHARQMDAARDVLRLAARQFQLSGRHIAQVHFVVGIAEQRRREFAVHTGELQQTRTGTRIDLAQRLVEQRVVLPEQDGVDDGLMVEEPDALVPQIGPPVIARQIFGHASFDESPVDCHQTCARGLCGALANRRSYSQFGNHFKIRPTSAICHGTTLKEQPRSITRAIRRAASSASSMNGMG